MSVATAFPLTILPPYLFYRSLLRLLGKNLMFIGPCIIAIVDEWKANLMSLAILFRLLCAQHVSDINISIFRSLRLCWWITTSVVLFSVRCVLEFLVRLLFGGVRFAGWSTTVLKNHRIYRIFINFHVICLKWSLRMTINSSFLAGRNYARLITGSRVNKMRLLQLFGRINTDCHVFNIEY